MKRLIIIFMSLSLCLSFFATPTAASKEASECWYIKRNGHNAPSFPKCAEELKELNCLYLDDVSAAKGEHRIYLTFDAGYSNENLEQIMDILSEEKVCAAFFLLDNIILKNTDLVNRMAKDGHLVCNHTKNHKNLSFSTKEQIFEDLSALEAIYKEKTGREMTKYFRFPEGKYSLDAVKKVCELGYTTVFWSFGYDDWDNSRQMSPEKAKKKILDNIHDGEVLLLHPTSATNAQILRDVIKECRAMGYEFYSLDNFGK